MTPKIRQTVQEDLKKALLKPTQRELSGDGHGEKMPENEEELHSLLMMEGFGGRGAGYLLTGWRPRPGRDWPVMWSPEYG